jgi:dihydrofolate reductase
MPEIIIIAAVSRNGVIGVNGELPWNIPEEFQQFLAHVRGHTAVMGRRSFEAFAGTMHAKRCIVVSRSRPAYPDALVSPSFHAAVTLARHFPETVWITGGAEIYRQAIPVADAMYLSTIKRDVAGDTHFPDWDPTPWDLEQQRDHAEFEFRIWRRKRPATESL